MHNLTDKQIMEQIKNFNKSEVIMILNQYEIPFKSNESLKKLKEHAAREIAMIGVYKRIAKIQ